jgi:hypothetical protein
MPSYTVPIDGPNGPGFMTVNASDEASARENAGQGGDHATGGAVLGGHQAHTGAGGTAVAGYPQGYDAAGQIAGRQTGKPASQMSDDEALKALIEGRDALLKAIAEGNMDAFREAVRQFDVTFGLDKDKFAQAVKEFSMNFGLLEGGLMGTYQGQPTLAAQKQKFDQAIAAAGLTGMYEGQQTLPAQQQYFAQGLQGVTLAAGLQANPFRQQQVLGQLGGLLGGGSVAGFQAPNTVAGVGTQGGNTQGGLGYLQQMIDDIRNPTANQTNVNQVLDAIPTPNKLNSVDFLRAAPSTQQMVLQGMQEKFGIDPNDAMSQIKATLPQFRAPTTSGAIAR